MHTLAYGRVMVSGTAANGTHVYCPQHPSFSCVSPDYLRRLPNIFSCSLLPGTIQTNLVSVTSLRRCPWGHCLAVRLPDCPLGSLRDVGTRESSD
jgi:hypothetical protein